MHLLRGQMCFYEWLTEDVVFVSGTNRTGKEIRFRFWLSEDKAGKEAKRRPTGW